MSEFAHRSGKPLTCLCMALKVHKEETVDGGGNRVFRTGLRIGGGIDQDYSKSMYNDNGVYITHVEPNSPADRAGVKVHDKILQVNGIDYTMITHNRAVKYLKKDQVLDVLVARPKVLEEDV